MKIKEFREQRGMTQEVLAKACGVTPRTIQRAEAGNVISLETLTSIASVFEVRPTELIQKKDVESYSFNDENSLSLRRVYSGREIIKDLTTCFMASLEFDAEPNENNKNKLISLSKQIEDLIPDPWSREYYYRENLTVSKKIELSALISQLIAELDALKISVYLGRYVSEKLVPKFNPYENSIDTEYGQAKEPVVISKIIISERRSDKISVQVDDLLF